MRTSALPRQLRHRIRRRRHLIRETCKRCYRENPVGFALPDDVWASAVPAKYRSSVLCIFCFDELATRRNVDWSSSPVEWWPVSGVYSAPRSWRRSDTNLAAPRALTFARKNSS